MKKRPSEYVKEVEAETFKRIKASSTRGSYDLVKVLEMMNH